MMTNKEWKNLKKQHDGMLLLFRVDDFYEAFNDDAVIVGTIFDRRTTTRFYGSIDMTMIGFPHKELDLCLRKLLKAGYRVAIMDQVK